MKKIKNKINGRLSIEIKRPYKCLFDLTFGKSSAKEDIDDIVILEFLTIFSASSHELNINF